MRRGAGWPRRATSAASLLLVLPLAACGGYAEDIRAADLCARYDQAVAAADDFRQQDLVAEGSADVRAEVDQLQANLDQLQAVAEGRLDQAISDLQTALDEVTQAAVDAGDEARQAAQELVAEDLEDVATAWATVRGALEAECG
jgi:hypothetical protein